MTVGLPCTPMMTSLFFTFHHLYSFLSRIEKKSDIHSGSNITMPIASVAWWQAEQEQHAESSF